MAEQASPRVAYRGFISYSHRDERAGAKLHRRLETYKLPKQLIGTETARGIVPERLTPIFRDREELSAGNSLSDQVQQALVASDALIILCSPNAKASVWVGKEIETFRALHPDRPILAALLEGEPEDSFPDALTQGGAEPIAADLRKAKDGWRLGQQKLIAGLTGVPLDALVRRDAQRQLRRVTAITVSAIVAMLVMGLLLVAALRARAEADRQRAEAEGLVEYMLTDLRDKLKGVGRLDVMTAVNQRAMGYYGAQGDLKSLPPESLDRRARILHAMGEDDEKRGDLGLALKKFEEAHRATAAVLAQKPNDADAIFAHAQSEYWVGRVHELREDWQPALIQFQRYAALSKKLGLIDPKSQKYMMEMGWGRLNIGIVELHGQNNSVTARENFKAALQLFTGALEQNRKSSAIQFEIANANAWIADTYFIEGKIDLSVSYRKKELNLCEIIYNQDTKNQDSEFNLGSAERSIAISYQAAKKKQLARHFYSRSLNRFSNICDSDYLNKESCSLKKKTIFEIAHLH